MDSPTLRTPVGTAPVIPIMIMAFGGYLCWFGVHYWRSETAWPTDPLKAVLTGQPLPVPDRSADEAAVQSIVSAAQASKASGGVSTGPVGSGSATGDEIANKALDHIGAGYVYGGRADKPGNWDCSSYVSYVLGHDCGLPLPGGHWGDPGMPPHAHGPATTNYMMYGTPVASSQVKKGDLVVSSEHMGIVVADGTYISAKTPQAGTGLGRWDQGFPGGTPVFRRVA
jgi:cell wall-associated NlpC family hydrolase